MKPPFNLYEADQKSEGHGKLGLLVGLLLIITLVFWSFLPFLFALILGVVCISLIYGLVPYFSRDNRLKSADTMIDAESIKELRAIYPRSSPIGTTLVRNNADEAHLKVRAAVYLWHWLAPLLWSVVGVFLGLPSGILMGLILADQANIYFGAALVTFVVSGAIALTAPFIALAARSYFRNRLWVHIAITPSRISVGGAAYLREHFRGIQIGHTSSETELPDYFFAPRSGVQRLRIAYGDWFEDLPYMINAYHSAEIAIWINGIIDSVGAPARPHNDPYAGRKIELL